MGTIKKGAANRYQVLADVASGNMQTALANLANAVVFYSQVSTTGGTASTKSYSNSNQYPTLASLTDGMIVQIGWTAAEVTVAGLGEANVAVAGGSTQWNQIANLPNIAAAATNATTTLTIPSTPTSNILLVIRNGYEGISYTLSGATLTVPGSGSDGPDNYVIYYTGPDPVVAPNNNYVNDGYVTSGYVN